MVAPGMRMRIPTKAESLATVTVTGIPTERFDKEPPLAVNSVPSTVTVTPPATMFPDEVPCGPFGGAGASAVHTGAPFGNAHVDSRKSSTVVQKKKSKEGVNVIKNLMILSGRPPLYVYVACQIM
jgi:hypothetical protein